MIFVGGKDDDDMNALRVMDSLIIFVHSKRCSADADGDERFSTAKVFLIYHSLVQKMLKIPKRNLNFETGK